MKCPETWIISEEQGLWTYIGNEPAKNLCKTILDVPVSLRRWNDMLKREPWRKTKKYGWPNLTKRVVNALHTIAWANLLILLVEHGNDENQTGSHATLTHSWTNIETTQGSGSSYLPSRKRSAKKAPKDVPTACSIKTNPHRTIFTPEYKKHGFTQNVNTPTEVFCNPSFLRQIDRRKLPDQKACGYRWISILNSLLLTEIECQRYQVVVLRKRMSSSVVDQ